MRDFEFEPERYELREPPAYEFIPTRREFLEIAGVGLLVTVTAGEAGAATEIAGRLLVGDDGIVTVYSGKVEVGQGSRTEIAMAAAEELGVAIDKVRVVMADTDVVPVDGITAGSRTTPSTVPAVRKAAAEARDKLNPGSKPSGKILGTPQRRVGGRGIVTGEHRFPSDIRRPGMTYGAVLRAPSFGAVLKSIETASIRNATVVYDGKFAGCVASTSFSARKAVEALAATAKWEEKPHPPSSALFEHLRENQSRSGRGRETVRGLVAEAFAGAAKRLKASFQVSYIQHAPMEPRAAVAEWRQGKLTVWTGTQNPHGVRDQLSQAFNVDKASVP
jgi:isoquinoline 1-oxidoreductase